jgi:hypothetical protein
MADIGFTSVLSVSTIKKGASTASATMTKYSDGSFEFTAGSATKRCAPDLASAEFVDFILAKINALV